MREFMEEELGPEPELPQVCSKLRTKTAFGALSGVHAWQHGDSSTAVYWCLRTMGTVGPDESYAHPHCCCAGRQCFKPDDE
jgi:hypothetical protein